ncbi:MAG: phosphoribosylformylglycinamidine synthase subunit PurS [Candidatus Hydrothermae bacterium]|nr:phosphoribosylformylglycinamidine synthase subunit PurS [Candidatus Hydrothermae bacterium]
MGRWKGEVGVFLREDLLDPQGRAIGEALHQHGIPAVDTRMGKVIRFYLDHMDPELEKKIQEMAEHFLANPVIESWEVRIEEGTA